MMDAQHRVFGNPDLLVIPTRRAAWSDRTALLMAEMSKLAYRKFEVGPGENVMTQADLDRVLERLLHQGGAGAGVRLAEADDPPEDSVLPEEALSLRDDLARAGFELAGLFSDPKSDTQAFLAVSMAKSPEIARGEVGIGPDSRAEVRPFGDEEVAVLSFRGTGSLKDWLNNAMFLQGDVAGIQVHQGFQRAFDAVRLDIEARLNPLVMAGRTLYVTGHSLGGALALIATREMGSDSFGACYTFGSPRVGRFGFARNIKTPIYRVVNANDLVPRLPAAYFPSVLLFVLRVLKVSRSGMLSRLIQKGKIYVHYGDMRFLRLTRNPTHDDVQVLSNPSVIYRFLWFWPALLANWRSPLDHHDINLYCAKLAAYAIIRNPALEPSVIISKRSTPEVNPVGSGLNPGPHQ